MMLGITAQRRRAAAVDSVGIVDSAGGPEASPLDMVFNGITIADYFDPQPSNLIDGTEVFTSDTGQFTQYTEGTAGTFSIVSSTGQIAHTAGAGANLNTIETITAGSVSIPNAFVSVDLVSSAVSSTGYDVMAVGLVNDGNNFVIAAWDRVASVIRIQVKVSGTNTNLASVGSQTWSAGSKLAMSLVGTSVCTYKDTGSGWVYVGGADIAAYYDTKVSGNLSGYKPGIMLASQNDSTKTYDNLTWGRFGGVGMRDHTIVTNPDGTVYDDGSGYIYFSATSPDPRGDAYASVFKIDPVALDYEQTAAIMIDRGGNIQNDLVPHIIRSGSDSRIVIGTWGNGFGGTIEVLHKLETGVDLTSGTHTVSSMTALSLPGHGGSSYGEYDAMLVWDSDASRWMLAYTITSNTNFIGSPFYAALAHSTDLSSWTQIGSPDTGNTGYEGTKLVRARGEYWVVAGGPAGNGNTTRVYDAVTFTHHGAIDAGFFGGSDTQPHSAVFAYGNYFYCLSFDNTRYGSASFTWGQPTLQRSERYITDIQTADYPQCDEFDVGSSIDTAGTRFSGATPWAWENQGGATESISSEVLSIVAPASASFDFRGLEMSISLSSFVFRAKMTASFTLSDYCSTGMYVRNSSSGRVVTLGYQRSGGSVFEGYEATSPSGFNASATGGSFSMLGSYLTDPKYFEIELSGSDILLRTSVDGCRWTLRGTEPLAAWISSIDRIGLFANSENSNAVTGAFEWIRRIS